MGEGGKRILVAGESRTFVMYISIILRRFDFDVVAASNAMDALKLARLYPPDLFFLEFMPPLDEGMKMLGHIRRDGRFSDIPVVVVSTHVSDEVRNMLEEFRCSGVLTKPIRIRELNDVLSRCIIFRQDRNRRFLRAHFERRVHFRAGSFSDTLVATNLSRGGVFVRKLDPLPEGTGVELRIPLHHGREVTVRGVVVYRKELFGAQFNEGPGMGIEFRDMDDATADALEEFIASFVTDNLLDGDDDMPVQIEPPEA